MGAGTGPEQKKKHHPGCFFFCSGLGRRHGAGAKKKNPGPARTGWCFVFYCGRARTLTHSLWAGAILARPGWCCFFFAAAPRERSLTHCRPGWCLPLAGVVFFFFAAAPPGRGGDFFFAVAPPRRSLTHCGLGRFGQGRMVFFFCCGPAGSFLVSLKRPGGAAAKKKHHGAVFFFCCGAARTLTHSLRAWVVPSPRRGGVFFFLLRPGPDGVVFFFCCGPAQTLTHSLWAGAISARPDGVFFFCCGPQGLFWLV